MDCEVLIQPNTAARGEKMLRSMVAAAGAVGINARAVTEYTASTPWLMTYGLGHPVRRQWTDQHKAAGGRVIAFDLGYWDRDVPLRFNMRLTIDDDHPHKWIEPMPAGRFEAAKIVMRNEYDAAGPVLLCGLGQKQRDLKGLEELEWERKQMGWIRKHYPGRHVYYKPKRWRESAPSGAMNSPREIEVALRGKSLLVCSHSNVAVDACIAGVPVKCEDGAAWALYQNGFSPTWEQRLGFLRSLAWWQWNPMEAKQAWQFIKQRLSA